MGLFRPTEEEERSFLGLLRHAVLEGPLQLMRFSSRGHQGGEGAYWMYASEIVELIQSVERAGPYGGRVIRELSRRWAICDDWSDLQSAWVMNLPAGANLHTYCGFAKFQPQTSVRTQRKSGRRSSAYYEGGSMQFVTRIGEQERRWVRGPFRTLGMTTPMLKRVLQFEPTDR